MNNATKAIKQKAVDLVEDLCRDNGVGYWEVLGALVAHRREYIPLVRELRNPARDSVYMDYIRGFGCFECGCSGVEAHHHGPRGMGQKTDDYRTIPLCPEHHRAYHNGRLELDGAEVLGFQVGAMVGYIQAMRGL